MQTEKSPLEGKRKMPETRFRHYPLTRVLEFLGMHQRPMADYFSTFDIKNYYLSVVSFIFDILCRRTTFSERHSVFLAVEQK